MDRHGLRIFLAAVVAAAVAACGSANERAGQAATAPASGKAGASPPEAPPAPAAFASPVDEPRGYTGELAPLPQPAFAAARPPQIVQAVYTFAARHPEVLRYVPCFCGCESRGHRHNEDCFIAGRDADGRPRWEEHGMG